LFEVVLPFSNKKHLAKERSGIELSGSMHPLKLIIMSKGVKTWLKKRLFIKTLGKCASL